MDHDLLKKYRESGNLKFLAELYQLYQPRVFRLCMHYLKNAQDSEDAVVDIFLELKDKVARYDIRNFASWLHTLGRNHCLKKLRSKGKVLIVDVEKYDHPVESVPVMDQLDVWLEKLPDAIDRLDERQRWCIVLFYLHGKSYRDIETEKGYSAMEVKSAIQNGKIKLKKFLESDA